MYQQKLCLGVLGGVVPGAEQIPMLRDAGFQNVNVKNLAFGAAALHTANKAQ